jgi:hypothetical protein
VSDSHPDRGLGDGAGLAVAGAGGEPGLVSLDAVAVDRGDVSDKGVVVDGVAGELAQGGVDHHDRRRSKADAELVEVAGHGLGEADSAAGRGAQVSRLLIAHFPPTFPLEGVQ